jgi:hypothetical protein
MPVAILMRGEYPHRLGALLSRRNDSILGSSGAIGGFLSMNSQSPRFRRSFA